jgi:hypothetical protein
MKSRIVLGTSPDPGGAFRLVGVIDGQPVSASCKMQRVVCSRALWERAQLVVALGERIGYVGGPEFAASLDTTMVAMFYTFVRACDDVTLAEIAMPADGYGSVGGEVAFSIGPEHDD